MKQVYTSPDTAEVGLVKNMLTKAGIRCVELNEATAQVFPVTAFQAEVWVENDDDYPVAKALVGTWANPEAKAEEAWNCPRCGERLEGQFTKCWHCGTKRGFQAEAP